MAQREQALARAPLFSSLPRRQRRAIAEVTWVWTYPEKTVIVEEGKPGHSFFVILEGRATVLKGKRAVDELSPGGFFGEISLLDPGPRTASVLAQTPVTCVELAAKDFLDVIDAESAIAGKLLRALARRLREAEGPLIG